MIFPRYSALIKFGFILFYSSSSYPPQYLKRNENNVKILTKHIIEDEYGIHLAIDSNFNSYDTFEINNSEENIISNSEP